MAAVKQKCYICDDEVTESDYRRELTCSYTACPGSDQAYHEECINDHLRRLKLPADRLIGYQCPALLGNGKPCTGCITRTHHKIPLNHKKKQKRVEAAAAAAAAAAAPKPKPPAAKPKQAVTGVAVATAAMRPTVEALIRQAGVSVTAIKSGIPNIKNAGPPVAIGKGPAAKLAGTALAVYNNSATEPDHVVRQRVIPGWTDPKELAMSHNLEQQRAKAAALKAEALAAAGRGAKATALAGTSGFKPVSSGPVPLATRPVAGDRSRAPPAAAAAKASLQQQHQINSQDETSSDESDESNTDPFSRWLRSEDTDDIPASEQNFNLAPEDLPAIPASASGSVPATPSKATIASSSVSANKFAGLERSDSGSGGGAVPLQSNVSIPEAPAQSDAPSSPDAVTGATTPRGEEVDPIVAYDQIYMWEDQTLVVKDAYDNYFSVYAIYGESPEMIGFSSEDGDPPIYYVIVRESHVTAQQQALDGEGVSSNNGGDAGTLGDATPAQAQVPAPLLPQPVTAPGAAQAYDTQLAGMSISRPGVDTSAPVGAVEVNQLMASPAPAGPELGGLAEDGGEDLDDILALCMGEATASAPATHAATVRSSTFMTGYGASQPSFYAPAPAMPVPLQPQPVPVLGTFYGDVSMGTTAAPAGCGEVEQNEAEDVDSLMQLLCI